MQSHACRLLFAAAAAWALSGCGRLGFEEHALDAGTIDNMSNAVEVDAGAVVDANEPMPDAGAPSAPLPVFDAAISIDSSDTIAVSDPAPQTDAAISGDAEPDDAVTVADAGPTMCPSVRPKTGTELLIDDMEDGDTSIAEIDGRRGGWYVNNDGTRGYQTPAYGAPFTTVMPGAAGSMYAVRTTGVGFNDWGAAIGVVLSNASGNRCPYDASATHGLRLYARGAGTVTVSIATTGTVPIEHGGRCIGMCYDYHAVAITLSNAWTMHTLPWYAFAQGGWGTPGPFVLGGMMYIEFGFDAGTAFDLSVDNLAFY